MTTIDTSQWRPCAKCKKRPVVSLADSSPIDEKVFLILGCGCDTETTFVDSPVSRESLREVWDKEQVQAISSAFGF